MFVYIIIVRMGDIQDMHFRIDIFKFPLHSNHIMKNDTSQRLLTWETPDITVLPINDVTLGVRDFGGDFGLELSF